jgi:hypothetical protein
LAARLVFSAAAIRVMYALADVRALVSGDLPRQHDTIKADRFE